MTTIKEINQEFDEIYKKNGLENLFGGIVSLGWAALFCYNHFYLDKYADKAGLFAKWVFPLWSSFMIAMFGIVIPVTIIYGIVLIWCVYFRNRG